MNEPSPYSPGGVSLPRTQSRLEAVMPVRAVKPRFLELAAKPERYVLTGLRAGGPKTTNAGQKLDVLVVACLRNEHGVAHEWEITAKGAYATLRGILEQLPSEELEALLDGTGNLPLDLAVTGKGTSTTYLVRRSAA